jgi:hypothetical protein
VGASVTVSAPRDASGATPAGRAAPMAEKSSKN